MSAAFPNAPATAGTPDLAVRRAARFMGGVALLVLLAACGGGGGEGDGSSGTGGTTQTSTFLPAPGFLGQGFVESFAPYEAVAATLRSSAQYVAQKIDWQFTQSGPVRSTFPLASARIEYAHAAGLTGAGSSIAVLDDGFLTTHEALAGVQLGLPLTGPTVPVRDHGTAVAGVLAGEATTGGTPAQSRNFIGVAPDVSLVLGAYTSPSTRAELTERAITAGSVAINNSWGFQNRYATQADFDVVFGGTDSAYLAALRRYTQNGVVVFAASNQSGDTTAGLMDGLPLLVPELRPGWLSVINADATWDADRILSATRLSAPCNDSGPWCLAAEGTWLAPNATSPTGYSLVTGTSFAAPMVSGALALLDQAFPNLTPHQLRLRLLASADNRFAEFQKTGSVELAAGFFHDYSAEWGHGFLDVRAALLPIGTTVSTLADGSRIDVSEPFAVTGGAVGDAVTRSLSGVQMLATDSLGGDFDLAPEALVARSVAPSAGARLMGLAQGMGGGAILTEYGGAQLHLMAGGTEVAALAPLGDGDDPLGLSVGRTVEAGSGALYLGLNVTRDDGRLLPSAIDGSAPVMHGIELGYATERGDGFLSVGAGIAWAETEAMGPIGGADLKLTTLGFETGRRDLFTRGDSLRLAVGLPMAVAAGSAPALLPTARSHTGLTYDSVTVDFAPEAREVNLGLVYDLRLAEGADMVMGAVHSVNSGHVAGQSDSAAMLGLRLTF